MEFDARRALENSVRGCGLAMQTLCTRCKCFVFGKTRKPGAGKCFVSVGKMGKCESNNCCFMALRRKWGRGGVRTGDMPDRLSRAGVQFR